MTMKLKTQHLQRQTLNCYIAVAKTCENCSPSVNTQRWLQGRGGHTPGLGCVVQGPVRTTSHLPTTASNNNTYYVISCPSTNYDAHKWWREIMRSQCHVKQ